MFSPPIPSLLPSSSPSTFTTAVPLSPEGATSLAQMAVLHQPFVVGPDFSLVTAQLVSQIVAAKFIEFNDLLSLNIVLV